MNFVFIIIGGGIGALFRYLSSQMVNSLFSSKYLLGTLFVNCVGAFLIGFLMNTFDFYSVNTKWKLFIVTGFLGGYTTFSAYSYETAKYFLSGNIKYAILNIILNNVLCVAFVLLGIWINKIIFIK